MSNINVMRKNLGPVTAYKYAVQQGYTGTEQEFAALMASYATVAKEAEAAKDDAVDAKTAAEAAQAAAEAAASQAEGAINVDDTLSVRGRAADSEVTGKKINSTTGNISIPLYAKNRYIDLSGTSVAIDNGIPQLSNGTSTYNVYMMECSEGDIFTINGTGGSSARLWGFIKNDGSIIVRALPSVTGTDVKVIAPFGAAWIITHTNDYEISYKGELIKDTVERIKSHITENVNITWEIGNIGTNGADAPSTTRIKSSAIDYDDSMIVNIGEGVKISIRGYDATGTIVYNSPQWSYTSIFLSSEVPNTVKTIRFVASYFDDSDITDVEDITSTITLTIYLTSKHLNYTVDKHDHDIASLKQNMSVNTDIEWELGTIGANNGVESSSTTRIRSKDFDYDRDLVVSINEGYKYSFRYYDADGNFIRSSPTWKTSGGVLSELVSEDRAQDANVKTIRIVAAYVDDAVITSASDTGNNISLSFVGNLRDLYSAVNDGTKRITINKTGLGNCGIRCAKEQSYLDGTSPVIEWFLLEEPYTNRMYYSKDLQSKQLLFTFPYDTYKYSFGILQNGDIIACLDPASITVDNKSDANRVNPYVYLASENWSICHEVDFGDSLKPCGWASNQGFKVLANGDACFCEYTRQTTYTANVWKIIGSPLDANNWTVTKSFVVTSTDNSTLFKHCHMIMQDFFTGVCYLTTGDDNIGSMTFASTDNCDTWTQLVTPDSDGQINQYGYINGSEKYCRMAMMLFTEDYIYWASDTPSAAYHYLFRCERDENGVLDYDTVEDLVNIPYNNGASSYGCALIPELNVIMLLDRCDIHAHEMDLRLITLSDNQLVTIGKLIGVPVTEDGVNVGFRCRFSEWYPINGLIHVGFDMKVNRSNHAVNHIKGFGNKGLTTNPDKNINNLAMQIFYDGAHYGYKMHTFYI